MNKVKDKNHILWVDYAKFIGIFMVVLGHLLANKTAVHYGLNAKPLYNFIYLFHMPLFFIISGYLYKQKDKIHNLQGLLYGILIPYILYQLIYLPLSVGCLCFKYHYPFISTLIKNIIGIITGDGYNTSHFYSVCVPCWFLVTMLHIRIIFNYIKITPLHLFIISIFSFILLKILLILNIDLYFCLDNTLYAIPFFSIGYYAKEVLKDNKNIYDYKKWLIQICENFIIIGTMLFIIKINGTTSMNLKISNMNNYSLFLSYFAGILGTLLIYNISRFIKRTNNFVQVVSQNTLFIIFSHCVIIYILNAFNCFKVFSLSTSTIINIALAIIFAIFILCINYLVISKFLYKFPILLGKSYKK